MQGMEFGVGEMDTASLVCHVCDMHIFLFGGRIFLAFFKWQLATNIHGLPPMKHFKPELIEAA